MCAVDVSVVDDALAHLGCTADVLTIDPHTLDEVFESILTLGRATGHLDAASALVESQRARLAAVRSRIAGLPRPRVMLLEWTDPPYAPGHWMPEMIEAAGGEPLLAAPGAKSERVTWEAIRAARPELVVAAPCGFDLAARPARRRPGGERRAAARRTRPRRGRQRSVGPARHPAGGRRGGPGCGPAPRVSNPRVICTTAKFDFGAYSSFTCRLRLRWSPCLTSTR